MRIIVYIFFVFIFFYSNSQSKNYGRYVYWDKIKYDLINHPNLKIIDFETGLTWMVTVVNKDVKNSLHADVEPSSILDQIKSITILLNPIIPLATSKIFDILNLNIKNINLEIINNNSYLSYPFKNLNLSILQIIIFAYTMRPSYYS